MVRGAFLAYSYFGYKCQFRRLISPWYHDKSLELVRRYPLPRSPRDRFPAYPPNHDWRSSWTMGASE